MSAVDAAAVRRLWFEKLRFCGCGSRGDVLGKIRDSLAALDAVSKAHRSSKECYPMGKATPEMEALHGAARAALGPDDAMYYLMAYTLHAAGLTEHGGAVPGWLTDEGERLLSIIRNKTDDDLDEMLDDDEFDDG